MKKTSLAISLLILTLGINAQTIKKPIITCNPTDSNIGFEQGTLSGWNAYYAMNNSDTTKFIIDSITGGPCSNTVCAANDPITNFSSNPDYQIFITTGGRDPLITSISRVSPYSSYRSVRLGDSINPNQGVAILSQEFLVTPSATGFQYQYAAILENPIGSHTYYEQPFFSVLFLDQIGDTIFSKIITGSNAGQEGFDSVFYPTDFDYVYYKNWTSDTISLKAYLGQCITVQFEASDCALGGHFGYAYIDGSSGPLGIKELENNISFTTFPVPATNTLNVTFANNGFKPQQAIVYDISGREVFKQDISMKENTIVLDVSQLNNGAYILMLVTGNIHRQTKFIVAR